MASCSKTVFRVKRRRVAGGIGLARVFVVSRHISPCSLPWVPSGLRPLSDPCWRLWKTAGLGIQTGIVFPRQPLPASAANWIATGRVAGSVGAKEQGRICSLLFDTLY